MQRKAKVSEPAEDLEVARLAGNDRKTLDWLWLVGRVKGGYCALQKMLGEDK